MIKIYYVKKFKRLKYKIISGGQRLIASKIKVVYIICVYNLYLYIFIIYKYI